MAKPKISVITPNYNHGHFLDEMLESTLSQSCPPDEIIIIDDASTDDSISLIEKYCAKYPQIRFFKNNTNAGANFSVNRALEIATGDFFVFRSVDDLSLPGFFEKASSMLIENPAAGLCCGDLLHFTNNVNDAQLEPSLFSEYANYFTKNDAPFILGSKAIQGHTVMARADAVLKAGNYLPGLEWYADWFCFLVIALRQGFCYVPEPFAASRMSSDSFGNAMSSHCHKQQTIIAVILNTIKNDYRDIIPQIIKSGVLQYFYPHIINVISENESLRDSETHLMVQSAFHRWNEEHAHVHEKKGISQIIQKKLLDKKENICSLKKKFPDKKIVIYGSGGHTRELLNNWDQMKLPEVHAICQTTQPKSLSYAGLPLYAIDSFIPDEIGLVIVSSKSFEEAMVRECRQHLPRVPLLTFWDKRSTTL